MRVSNEQAKWWALLVILVLVCALALIGFFLGQASVLASTQPFLTAYADRLLVHADELADEYVSMSRALEATHQPKCSDADIAILRLVVFRARFVNDIGRVRDGKVICSAALGRPPRPIDLGKPDVTGVEGRKVYRSVTFPLAKPTSRTVAVLYRSDVVLAPDIFSGYDQLPLHYLVAVVDASRNRTVIAAGNAAGIASGWFRRRGFWHDAGALAVTRCSSRYTICVVVTISPSDAERVARRLVLGITLFGGVFGAALGLAGLVAFRRTRSVVAQLRRAIRRARIFAEYQPIVNLHDGKIVGVEALARWKDDYGNFIPPTVFVRLAEDGGFIGELTESVLGRAVEELGDVLRRNPELQINLNVAAAELEDARTLDVLTRHVDGAGLRRSQVCLEITESAVVREPALPAIARLRELGHPVVIDDFGTGYSSLAYLHRFKFDYIKIPRELTSGIGTEAPAVSVIPQLLDIARLLDVGTVVEGIETEAQLRYFTGVRPPLFGQGWYFGRPGSAEDVRARVASDETQ